MVQAICHSITILLLSFLLRNLQRRRVWTGYTKAQLRNVRFCLRKKTAIFTFSFSLQHKTQGQPLWCVFFQTDDIVFRACLQFEEEIAKCHTSQDITHIPLRMLQDLPFSLTRFCFNASRFKFLHFRVTESSSLARNRATAFPAHRPRSVSLSPLKFDVNAISHYVKLL